MANIKPFNAVRPKNGLEAVISALPYDVYNRKEAKEEVCKNPRSFLKIDRAESQFPDDVDTYDEIVYLKAKEMYEEMLSDGEFIKDEKPGLYLYEETMNGRSQTGLVCTASVLDYQTGVIKKHENTRADKELDRIHHVDTLNAQTGPIFLAYRDRESLNTVFSEIKTLKPYFDFESMDGVRHKGWIISDSEIIERIVGEFKHIDSLYIADGHHRCASAAKVSMMRREAASIIDEEAEYNYFLSVIFPESELMIMDYNRVVYDLNNKSVSEFLAEISDHFYIREIPVTNEKPSEKGTIFMFLENKEFELKIHETLISNDPIEALDVSVLQNYLLEPVLGIKDPKTDKRIDFVGGIRGVEELRRRITVDGKVAFALYPTLMKELFNVADAGLLMPPKSTWFEPKLRSGLFIHELS